MTKKVVKESLITSTLLNPAEVIDKDPSIKEELELKIIDEVFSKKDIEVKTDLNTNLINQITRGKIYASKYKCSIMEELCNNIMILSVSKDRKGRKEFTEISKSIHSTEEEFNPTLKRRLMGE